MKTDTFSAMEESNDKITQWASKRFSGLSDVFLMLRFSYLLHAQGEDHFFVQKKEYDLLTRLIQAALHKKIVRPLPRPGKIVSPTNRTISDAL